MCSQAMAVQTATGRDFFPSRARSEGGHRLELRMQQRLLYVWGGGRGEADLAEAERSCAFMKTFSSHQLDDVRNLVHSQSSHPNRHAATSLFRTLGVYVIPCTRILRRRVVKYVQDSSPVA
jgi:hypothetical protein